MTGRERGTRKKSNEWKGLDLLERDSEKSRAFKTTGTGSVIWEAGDSPRKGTQSKEKPVRTLSSRQGMPHRHPVEYYQLLSQRKLGSLIFQMSQALALAANTHDKHLAKHKATGLKHVSV